jgi:lipid A ethanolaminephosphotransferase
VQTALHQADLDIFASCKGSAPPATLAHLASATLLSGGAAQQPAAGSAARKRS